MYDPSMRVLTVLEILQARGSVSAAELARRLEVSSRTVQRYVARLQDLGIPVLSTRGRGAEYILRPGFRMQPVMFNDDEAFAVALGLHALRHLGLGALVPTMAGVEAKLERIVPVATWDRMQAVSAALQLEKNEWVSAVDTGLVAALADAIRNRTEVEIDYVNQAQAQSHRTVQPYGLIRDNGVWFMAAYCCLRQDARLFRVDRIGAVKPTHVAFERPAVLDLRHFVQLRLQSIPARWQTDVWLETSTATLRFDRVPANARIDEEAGGLCLRCNVDDLVLYAAQLMTLGCRFVVRSPRELVTAFDALSERARTVALDASARGESRAHSAGTHP